MTIRDESHIHEPILLGFPGRSDDAIVINYRYQHRLLGLPVQAQIYIKNRKKTICIHNNQIIKFNKFNFISHFNTRQFSKK